LGPKAVMWRNQTRRPLCKYIFMLFFFTWNLHILEHVVKNKKKIVTRHTGFFLFLIDTKNFFNDTV
jgi:hypothetical protein